MSLIITKRKLTDGEIDLLTEDITQFPHLGYMGKNLWNRLGETYVAYINDSFVGVCTAVPLKGWVKIGPLEIIRKYQGYGYGKELISYVINRYPDINVFFGSSNPKIISIARKLKFKSENNFFRIPRTIQIYLMKYLWDRLSIRFLIDTWKKSLVKRHGDYHYFLRYNQQ